MASWDGYVYPYPADVPTRSVDVDVVVEYKAIVPVRFTHVSNAYAFALNPPLEPLTREQFNQLDQEEKMNYLYKDKLLPPGGTLDSLPAELMWPDEYEKTPQNSPTGYGPEPITPTPSRPEPPKNRRTRRLWAVSDGDDFNFAQLPPEGDDDVFNSIQEEIDNLTAPPSTVNVASIDTGFALKGLTGSSLAQRRRQKKGLPALNLAASSPNENPNLGVAELNNWTAPPSTALPQAPGASAFSFPSVPHINDELQAEVDNLIAPPSTVEVPRTVGLPVQRQATGFNLAPIAGNSLTQRRQKRLAKIDIEGSADDDFHVEVELLEEGDDDAFE